MIKLLILIAGINFSSSLNKNPLIEKIKANNTAMIERGRPSGNNVYEYNYTTEFQYWDEEMQMEKVQTKMYIGENDLHYFSNQFDLFIDVNYVATIMKDQRQIIITRAVQNYDPSFSMSQFALVQNYVLDSAKVISTKQLEDGLVELNLDTRNLGLANFYVENIIYQCDPKTGEIKKSISNYSEEYELKKMIFSLQGINLSATYSGFKPVEKILFKSNYTLVDKYKGYEVIVD